MIAEQTNYNTNKSVEFDKKSDGKRIVKEVKVGVQKKSHIDIPDLLKINKYV